MVVRVNGILSLFSSVAFVVLTADQFVGCDDGLLEQQKQDSHVCRKIKSHISSDFKETSESLLQR